MKIQMNRVWEALICGLVLSGCTDSSSSRPATSRPVTSGPNVVEVSRCLSQQSLKGQPSQAVERVLKGQIRDTVSVSLGGSGASIVYYWLGGSVIVVVHVGYLGSIEEEPVIGIVHAWPHHDEPYLTDFIEWKPLASGPAPLSSSDK